MVLVDVKELSDISNLEIFERNLRISLFCEKYFFIVTDKSEVIKRPFDIIEGLKAENIIERQW
jgi:hypothetical protein